MSYRRDGKQALALSKRWVAWLEIHHENVKIACLPLDVIASESKFAYFVDYTYNEDWWLNQTPIYSLGDLDFAKRVALWELIKAAHEEFWEGAHNTNITMLERTYGPLSWESEFGFKQQQYRNFSERAVEKS